MSVVRGTVSLTDSDLNGFVAKLTVDRQEVGSTVAWLVPDGSTAEIDGDDLYLPEFSWKNRKTYRALETTSTGTIHRHSYSLESHREAVVAVHGIGEQAEFKHATTYVKALARPLDEIYEQPFAIDEERGVRTRQFRLTWRPYRVEPTHTGGTLIFTDVYEHYWQPLLRGSQFANFAGFVRAMMLSDSPLPHRMKSVIAPVVALLLPLFVAALTSESGPLVASLHGLASAIVAVRLAGRTIRVGWFSILVASAVAVVGAYFLAMAMSRTELGPLSSPTVVGGLLAIFVALASALIVGRPRPEFPFWTPIGTPMVGVWALGSIAAAVVLLAASVATGVGKMSEPAETLSLAASKVVEPRTLILFSAVLAVILVLALGFGLKRKLGLVALTLVASIALGAAVADLPFNEDRSGLDALGQILFALVGGAFLGWVVNHLGDALRYLDSNPDNHSIRENLTKSGADLLARLHDSGRYDRIVVVGHSMGTMVAYDVVTRYWQRVFEDLPPTEEADFAEFEQETIPSLYSAVLTEPESVEPEQVRRNQLSISDSSEDVRSDYWRAQGDIAGRLARPGGGKRWLVTDLVTLACPYTYAHFTIPDLEFTFQVRRRSMIPPITQTAIPHVRYSEGSEFRFHQTALFAPTRWWNAYYSNDLVGGPIVPVFGPGARDIELQEPDLTSTLFPVNHTMYPKDERIQRLLRRILSPQIESEPLPDQVESLLEQGEIAANSALSDYESGYKSSGQLSDPPTAAFWDEARLRLIRRVDPILRRIGGKEDGDPADFPLPEDQVSPMPIHYRFWSPGATGARDDAIGESKSAEDPDNHEEEVEQ